MTCCFPTKKIELIKTFLSNKTLLKAAKGLFFIYSAWISITSSVRGVKNSLRKNRETVTKTINIVTPYAKYFLEKEDPFTFLMVDDGIENKGNMNFYSVTNCLILNIPNVFLRLLSSSTITDHILLYLD